MQLRADLLGAEDDEMHLHVGRRDVRTGAEEPAGIARADGEQALCGTECSAGPPSGCGGRLLITSFMVIGSVQRYWHAHLEMILQVGADARHVGDHVDAMRAQQLRRADAGELQDLRRIDRAARQRSPRRRACAMRVSSPCTIFDADGAAALEQNARRERAGFDLQIGALARRLQIADARSKQRRPLRAVSWK